MSTTYFDTLSKSYTQVPVTDEGIDTPSFLEATEGLINMLDLLGSSAFKPVQSDMSGNVKKIRERYNSDNAKNSTLQKLITSEKADNKKTATEGLLWLTRGLSFCAQALRHSHNNEAEELTESFTKAYETTLKPHHSMMVRPIFSLAMKACPYRKDFYAKLGSDTDKVRKQLSEWLVALEGHLQTLTKVVGV
ncbi:glycolipid transfer protein-like protein HET-C2 [Catenaria anguillulae PL171]|uniref:Glycolipid transfer protein-like protein HET-C2 n=1 Tax=Catenaria anguillulae PL171 TaxID=765915 RepID=A0A1Y2HK40_9FUNG|nr:glycolipid transfer protein-like protein HET-C2 [Catenaria anguillulae PL171]